MRIRLTDTVIEGLSCPPGSKDRIVFDGEIRGFGVRVMSNGRKVFLLQYKQAGRAKRLVLGTWGIELTTAQARKRAEQERGEVRKGKDPVSDRRAEDRKARATRDAERFTVEVMIDRWRDRHLVDRSESYRLRTPRDLKAALAGWLGKPAASLVKADAISLLDDAKEKRGRVAANRLRAVARACWDWSTERGDLEVNPWAATPKPMKETSRDRSLSDDELLRVWRGTEGLGHPWAGILRLLILTGQRRSEVAELAWSEIDIARAMWTLPRERSKNGAAHVVPLSKPAIEILQDLPRHDGGRLTFENSIRTAPSGFGRMKQRLDKALGEEFPAWTLHDLRRTVATGMQAIGVQPVVIEAVLNHVSGSRAGIVGVYQRHSYAAEKKAALDAWAAHVMGLVEERGEGAGSPTDDAVEAPPAKRGRGHPGGSRFMDDLTILQFLARWPEMTDLEVAKAISAQEAEWNATWRKAVGYQARYTDLSPGTVRKRVAWVRGELGAPTDPAETAKRAAARYASVEAKTFADPE